MMHKSLSVFAVALVVFLAAGWGVVDTGAAANKKILLIGTKPDHAYGTHMYQFECGLLAKCLEQTPGVEAVVQLEWPEDPQLFEGVKSVVFYSRPAGDIVLAQEHRERFESLMAQGVGYVAIHWATDASPENKQDYLAVLGGWFHRPPCGLNTTTSRLVQVDPAHPISRGWSDYELRDEFYLDLEFHPRTRPLLKVSVDGKEQVVGWAFERPGSSGGRSFGTTLGHFHDNFTREPFRRAIVNGILWTAHVDVPAEGAPVKLAESDMALPPEK